MVWKNFVIVIVMIKANKFEVLKGMESIRMKYETLKISTFERGMLDVTEVANITKNTRLNGFRNEDEAIRHFNDLGYVICGARSGTVFMTKQISE